MADPINVKLDFVFTGLNGGWSETFYITIDSLNAALETGYQSANKRTALLGKSGLMTEIRASDVAVIGDSSIDTRCQALPNSGLDDDSLQAAALCRLEGGNNHRRGYLVRGLPDDWITVNNQGTNMVLTGDGKKPLTAWFTSIMADPKYALRCKQRRGEAAGVGIPLEYKIINFTQGATNVNYTDVTIDATLIPNLIGTDMYIAGCRKSANAADGKWTILAKVPGDIPNTTVVTIPLLWGRMAYAQPAHWVKGVMYSAATIFPAISKAVYERMSIKKTGRPFDLPRGRARPRGR
jgi:hypothetical protein